MSIRAAIGIGGAAFFWCVTALAMEDVQLSGMREAPSPGGMRSVELPPMRSVELPPGGMREVQSLGGMRNVEAPAKQSRKSKSNDAYSKRRGKTIDPQGRGLNQAQIDAMERQRQLMWNATGGGMVYR